LLSLKNKLFDVHDAIRRVSPRGGVVVALIGADGAGKSTVIRDVCEWLEWKLDVKTVYFGTGDGPVSISRRILRCAARTVGAIRRPAQKHNPAHTPSPSLEVHNVESKKAEPSLTRRLARFAYAVIVACERRRNLVLARRTRNRGSIVLADRYPQCQFQDMMDSPNLSEWRGHSNRLIRHLANWEFSIYELASKTPPDLVIKLCVDAEVAKSRKHEHTDESLIRRCQIIRELEFPEQTRVAVVDANQPIENVLLEVKRAIWHAL